MHHVDLLVTLTGALAAALVLGFITNRLGLSPIVGYLLAGIVVGPHTPGFVADVHLAEQLAEIGVILLMFGVGLHFHPEELLRVRRVAVPGAIGQSLVATLLGVGVARTFGWDWTSGIVFGLAISVASTVVLLRVLTDRGDLHTPAGHIAVGWLVVEDLFTVFVLVVLPAVFGARQEAGAGLPAAIGIAALKVAALIVLTFLVGSRFVPWILEKVAHTRSRELFTLTVLVVALGIAVGAAKLFSVSAALGAFLAGMVVGRSEFSLRAASDAVPMRDAFAVLFFVSVGMLFDPRTLTRSPVLVAATIAVILIGKPLAAFGIVLFLKYPLKVALSVSVALAQIGEFSFILATRAREMGILTDEATNSLVAASIFSISINPLLYRSIQPIEAWVMRQRRLRDRLNAHVSMGLPLAGIRGSESATPDHRAIVVGYGPVGETVTRLLRENDIEPTIVELNLETVRRLREQGVNAVYGDASLAATLESAGTASTGTLILSASGVRHCEEVIRLARGLNPAIRVLARADYVREVSALREAGAARVFTGEGEVALALIEEILRSLGATPEQIDHARDRFRREALG